MKKTLFTLALALIVSAIFSAVWHVNNIPGITADFNNLDVACSSSQVADYDTLYVYGSPTQYANANLARPLTIIGPGYFLGQNPGLQNNLTPARVDYITFDVGSSGSLISGMTITNLTVYASNVVVQRNCIYELWIYGSNCIVLQNYISNPQVWQTEIYVNGANYLISNNYIPMGGNGWSFQATSNSSGVFANNIVEGSCEFYNAEVYNCIFSIFDDYWGRNFNFDANTSFHHNVFRAMNNWNWQTNTTITGEGNLYDVPGELYVATGSQDGYYQLCPGSPAIGVGISGQDCGIFGGLTPYHLSGIPAIPTIYEFTAPATGFVIPVQIKARSNN
ncbi:MAG TPA: hypothetical protein PKJ14_03610 [Candidatus Cloacimonadota bacterium]|nr:hypothetical protein [Candidatus Cloacimonadota bacterium]HQL14555.1 hypothetical protein [Candidatus Cloacimonadota bacterium]